MYRRGSRSVRFFAGQLQSHIQYDGMTARRLGLITTGHGPRPEVIAYHEEAMRAAGLEDVEVIARHALEGLSDTQIDAMEATPGEIGIGCHVRATGASGERTCGIRHRAVTPGRDKLIPHVQTCLEALEEEEQVDVAILCCAEEYAEGSLKATRPLILPYRSVFERVEQLVAGLKGQARLGLITPSVRHIQQDLRSWRSRPWMQKLQIHVEPLIGVGTGVEVASRLRAKSSAFDVAVIWGYSLGLAQKDRPDMIDEMERVLECPLILSRDVACAEASALLLPSVRSRLAEKM
jgi:protein AroM